VTGYDLHTHSRASDGVYAPDALVARAAAAGIRTLALTDHDTTAGLAEGQAAARQHGLQLVAGVEISVTWEKRTLHLVGLAIDPTHAPLAAGLLELQQIRAQRARTIGQRLEKAGLPGIYEEACRLAGDGMMTRTHFAACIARRGLAADMRDVFNRYLTTGKPGHVPTCWVAMETAIGWIRGAGGIAVLAHPQRYKLSGGWLRRLAGEFRDMGGEAVEVLSGTAAPGDVQASADLARRHGLLASCGSDFHGPDEAWPKLGRLPALPAGLTPVWECWRAASPPPAPRPWP